jgi:hypothetical protein
LTNPELEGRQAIPNDGSRGLADTLRKQGFKTSEEIDQLGEEARQAVIDGQQIENTGKCIEALRQEWGPDFEQNFKLVKDAEAMLLGSNENQGWLYESGAGRDPIFIDLFHKIAKHLKENYNLNFIKENT